VVDLPSILIFRIASINLLPRGLAGMSRSLQSLLLVLLVIDAILGTAVGAKRLATNPAPWAEDLYQRWVEERNLVHHHNPAADSPDAVMPYFDPQYKENGTLTNVLYPPWAFVSSLIFVPPAPFRIVRLYFMGMCLLSLGLMAYWAYRTAKPFGELWPAIAAVVPLSMASVSYCLSNGQYAIVIAGLLVGSLLMVERRQLILAGIFLGLSLLKPSLSLPFVVAFLALRLWLPVAVAVLWNIGTALAEWALTGCSPMFLMHQSSVNLHRWQNTSQNLITTIILQTAGSNQTVETAVMAAIGLAGAILILLARQKRCGIVTLFAIAAVTGLSWTYRKEYDAPVVVFLLIGLLAVALKTRNPLATAALVSCCVFLLLPFRMRHHNLLAMQVLEFLSWVLGIFVLMRWDRSGSKSEATEAVLAQS
jgi:hypothetical protein